ncbi:MULTISPECIES: hypothetical protein [unclassified Haloarcula]|uniref:hypothetical protein n=1 Tax=unclassified Haloarcula TaxID=2624677 RepID=UPI001786ED7A|nr:MULTISPECIES: hypothetical protein [unclassified Haloarcula]
MMHGEGHRSLDGNVGERVSLDVLDIVEISAVDRSWNEVGDVASVDYLAYLHGVDRSGW